MKTYSSAIFVTLAGGVFTAFSHDQLPQASSARILGVVPAGTPPPPEPPKPKFFVPARDVLETKSIQ